MLYFIAVSHRESVSRWRLFGHLFNSPLPTLGLGQDTSPKCRTSRCYQVSFPFSRLTFKILRVYYWCINLCACLQCTVWYRHGNDLRYHCSAGANSWIVARNGAGTYYE